MKNHIWDKLNDFVKELRCENISRDSSIATVECKKAEQEKMYSCVVYEQALKEITDDKRQKIIAYINSIENFCDAECDRAYIQGWIDCTIALIGVGILEPHTGIKDMINSFK